MQAEWLGGACNYCKRARRTRDGYWYCISRQNDYFPDADWDDDNSECPSYVPDPDCFCDFD